MKNKIAVIFFAVLLFAGCKSKYYSEDDYQSVLKIDSHIHIDTDDGVLEDQASSDNFIMITLNVDHSDSAAIANQFHYASLSVKKHPGWVFFGVTFFFDTAGFGTEAWSKKIIAQLDEEFKAEGVIGVKIWKNIGMTVRDRNGKFIMADDEALDPVINFIKSRNMTLNGHLGEPRNCWLPLEQMTVTSDKNYFREHPEYHMLLHTEYPSYEDQINVRDNLLKKNPDLTFIGSHLGSLEYNVDSLALRLDRFPNMAVDVSARVCHLQYQSSKDREKVRNFIIKYQDRLLYGTDVTYSGSKDTEGFKKDMHETWLADWKYFATEDELKVQQFDGTFKGLQLPSDVVDKIYRKNAIKWYKLNIQDDNTSSN